MGKILFERSTHGFFRGVEPRRDRFPTALKAGGFGDHAGPRRTPLGEGEDFRKRRPPTGHVGQTFLTTYDGPTVPERRRFKGGKWGCTGHGRCLDGRARCCVRHAEKKVPPHHPAFHTRRRKPVRVAFLDFVPFGIGGLQKFLISQLAIHAIVNPIKPGGILGGL